MTKFLISFADGAMSFPEAELPDVAKAAHAVVEEASVVATDGTVTDAPYPESTEHLGGFAVVDVPSREEGCSGLPRSRSPAAVRRGTGAPARPDRLIEGDPPRQSKLRPNAASKPGHRQIRAHVHGADSRR